MSKVFGLQRLEGFNVPDFEVLSFDFLSGCSDDELRLEISRVIERLDCLSYAVRSSANVEDSKDKSYSGLFKSYMDVTEEELIDCVKEVFSSIDISEEYGDKDIEMSVIIQRYIPAAYSGVSFTNLSGKFIISVVKGVCEDLVSGKISGDDIILDRETFCFFRRPEIQLDYSSLVRIFLRIEDLFGEPQDIEWVIDRDGELHIVQSRPITAG